MNLQVNPNLTVYLEAASRFFGEKTIYIQWKEMVKDADANWSIDPTNTNSIVGMAVDPAGYDAFTKLSDADKVSAYVTFLQSQYPAQ